MSNPQSPPHHPKPTERLRSVKQTCGAQKDQVYKCPGRPSGDGESPCHRRPHQQDPHPGQERPMREVITLGHRTGRIGGGPRAVSLLGGFSYTYSHTHSFTYTLTHMYTLMCTHISHMQTHSRILMHTSVHSYMHACVHTHTHSQGFCARMFWELMHVSTEACSKGDGGMWPPPTSRGCSGLHSPHVRLFVSSPGAPERAVWAPRLGDAGGQSTRKLAAVPQDQDTEKLLKISATYSSLSPS